ncbi:hypothetical protein P3S68_032890 [Capsicum galapagoense]
MPQQVEEQPLEGRECTICFVKRPLILHHLPYRGVYSHLCTACVLDSHPGSFCPICFDIFLHNPPPPHLCINAQNAPLSHTSLASLMLIPPPQGYLCPPCSNPNFTYFPATPNHDNAIEINLHLAKQLVVAARIVTEYIHSADNLARISTKNRVKETLSAKVEATQASERIKSRNRRNETEMVQPCEEEMNKCPNLELAMEGVKRGRGRPKKYREKR